MLRATVGKVTEAGFTRTVIEFARLHGWHAAHFRPARTATGWRTPCQGDAKGFPDLVLVRERVVYAELKLPGNRLTDGQAEWVRRLSAAGQAIYVWTPDSWPLIEKILGTRTEDRT